MIGNLPMPKPRVALAQGPSNHRTSEDYWQRIIKVIFSILVTLLLGHFPMDSRLPTIFCLVWIPSFPSWIFSGSRDEQSWKFGICWFENCGFSKAECYCSWYDAYICQLSVSFLENISENQGSYTLCDTPTGLKITVKMTRQLDFSSVKICSWLVRRSLIRIYKQWKTNHEKLFRDMLFDLWMLRSLTITLYKGERAILSSLRLL